jgi:hypothetical protein
MSRTASWIVLFALMFVLLGSCTAMAGNFDHWPASLSAVAAMLVGKVANDRFHVVKWPMEFVFWSAITMVFFNLLYLYWTA